MTLRDPVAQASLFDSPSAQPTAFGAAFKAGRVEVSSKPAREILMRATGFMEQYDFTLNPYSGCAFGCTYCYAAFFSRSAEKRDAWGEWVEVKENAVDLIERRKIGKLDGKCIYMSSVTDPYQPIERTVGLTRGVLQALADRHAPKLVVQTRSPDVVRDSDLFRQIEEQGGRVRVNMTVTTDDEDVRRTFEPFCPSNAQRLEAVTKLRQANIEVGVTMTPLLLVRDAEAFAESLLATGAEHFIAQPFHFARGTFVASTREGALALMAEKLGCDVASFQSRYLEHYGAVFEVLREALPELGEGKDGFAPPF
ncbi:MAG: radical SAM protein [Chloroflexi bacterium]|nr:radical SAM protein [Chloroflexota bacterium]